MFRGRQPSPIVEFQRLVGSTVALCGLIPGIIGVAMLVYVYLLAAPIEPQNRG